MTDKHDPKETGLSIEPASEGELNFHSLFTALTEGVAIHQMIYDINGKAIDYIIRDVNPSFEKNLGISVDKAIGSLASNLYELTPPPYIDIYEHVVKSGTPYFFTTYFQPLDKHFEISVYTPKQEWFATVFLDVTGSKRAVEALRLTGNKYRRLYESMMDGFVRTDMQGNIKEFNSCFRDMLDYTDEELRQLSWMDITPKHWHEYENRIINNQVIPHSYSNVYEKEYQKKDGTVFQVELRISLIRDEKGKPEGMWAVVRDITNRKKAENELEIMIDRLNLATRSGNMGVWEWNLKTDQILWDDKMFELYGIEKEEFKSTHDAWINMVHPEDISRVNEEIQRTLEGETEYHCEFRIILKDNCIRTIKSHAIVVRNSMGMPLWLTGINYDITKQVVAEKEIHESEQKYRNLYESMRDGFVLLDQKKHILQNNTFFLSMTGYSQEDIGNLKSIRNIVPEKWHKKVDDIINTQLMEDGYTDVFEIEYQRKDKSVFPVELRLFLFKNQQGEEEGIWAIIRDITDRKKLEDNVKEINTILEQKVEQKTKELQERVKELERFYKATVDRELRMKELRVIIEDLESQLVKINQ